MNAPRTAQQMILAAQAARGIIPSVFTCGCCGDEYDRDDHMADHFPDAVTALIKNRFGHNVCFDCADKEGTKILEAEQQAEWEEELACRAHEDSERHGWEQV